MKCAIDGCGNEVNGFHYYRDDIPLYKGKTEPILVVHCIVETPDGGGVCEYHTVRGVARLNEEYEEELAGEM